MRKRIHLNAFSMNCVSHIQHGLWVRDDTRQREVQPDRALDRARPAA